MAGQVGFGVYLLELAKDQSSDLWKGLDNYGLEFVVHPHDNLGHEFLIREIKGDRTIFGYVSDGPRSQTKVKLLACDFQEELKHIINTQVEDYLKKYKRLNLDWELEV